jgi:hypothetical protein
VRASTTGGSLSSSASIESHPNAAALDRPDAVRSLPTILLTDTTVAARCSVPQGHPAALWHGRCELAGVRLALPQRAGFNTRSPAPLPTSAGPGAVRGRMDCMGGAPDPADRRAGKDETSEPRWDFFVSYTSADRKWAEWIAWQLETTGYRVLVQAWDFIPGSNWATGMHEGIAGARRTIAVLSEAYLNSVYGRQEWQAAVAADPLGFAGKLVPIRIADCDRPGLLGQIVSFDLFGLSEDAAAARLTEQTAILRAGRAKPDAAPAFPASPTLDPQHTSPVTAPAFPGPVSSERHVPGDEFSTLKFERVWYLALPPEKSMVAMSTRLTGRLVVEREGALFQAKSLRLEIHRVRSVTVGHEGTDTVNPWVRVIYGDDESASSAYFADATAIGWGGIFGGTRKIYTALKALEQSPR